MLFERFKSMSNEELAKVRYYNLTATELEIVIAETVMSKTDRIISNMFFINEETYESIAEYLSNIPQSEMSIKTTSKDGVEAHRERLTAKLSKTFIVLVRAWDYAMEANMATFYKLRMDYDGIKVNKRYNT